MSAVQLLIVEDDEVQQASWKRQLERHNLSSDMKITPSFGACLADAEQLVRSNKYDAAIVDIRLKSPGGVQDANREGNEVRDLLIKSEVAIIAHLTGEPTAVEHRETLYHGLVKVFTKGEGVHDEILEWMSTKQPIIVTMQEVKSKIYSQLASLFYNSIWPRWEKWADATDRDDFLSESIARHMTSHLYSTLLEDNNGTVHPEEWYFQPPRLDKFYTGDMVFIEGKYYVLITPRCDLERLGDGSKLLFSRMDLAEAYFDEKAKTDAKIATKKQALNEAVTDEQRVILSASIAKEERKFSQKFYGHNGNAKKHFLPQVNPLVGKSHGPFFVDFGDMHAISFSSDDYRIFLEGRIAGLSPEFLPELVQRLGAYISRIGSPDFSHN